MEPSRASSLLVFESNYPIVYTDKTSKILGHSTSMLPWLGYTDSSISQADKLIIENSLQDFHLELLSNRPFSNNIEFTLEDGITRSMSIVGSPAIGEESHFTLLFEDIITENPESKILPEGQELAGIGTWDVNIESKIINYCDISQHLLNSPVDTKINLKTALVAFQEGYHRDNVVHQIQSAKSAHKKFDFESIIYLTPGQPKWVRLVGTPTIHEDKVVSICGLIIDIDKQKKQSKNLDKVNRRMRVALENTDISIWELNLIKNEMYWDASMFKLRYPMVQNLDPKIAFRNIAQEDHGKIYQAIQNCIKENGTYFVEFKMLSLNDSIRHIRSIGKLSRKSDGRPHRITGVNIDITEKKQKQTELKKLLEVTEKQNERLINFAYIISHNIRSHAGNIAMLADMLDTNLSSEERDDLISMIKVSTSNLNETLKQLNDVVTIQATDVTALKPIKLKAALLKALEGINALIHTSNAKLDIKVDESISVFGVEPYLISVLFNLFTNSIKYRSPNRALEISISAIVNEDNVQIEFSDNGIGIDLEKNRKKIFMMYKTFHTNKDARGIGLFITKNHVEAMNGEIEVSSKLDEGTTFQIKLKVANQKIDAYV